MKTARRKSQWWAWVVMAGHLAALALMVWLTVLMPKPAFGDPYQVPNLPIFTKPIPFCLHQQVMFKALATTRHVYSWSGRHEIQPAILTLFEHRVTGTWFLVDVKIGSVLACIRARGNDSRLQFGGPTL